MTPAIKLLGLGLLLAGCHKNAVGDTLDTGPFPLVVYLTRHAEKAAGNDPPLTKEGALRANALMLRMADVPLVAVYATGYLRTQQTAAPTAEAHGLTIDIDLDPSDELAEHILAEHQHEHVLVCGHSNTVPDTLEGLGMEDPPTIGSSDYGDLWILSRLGDDVKVETEHYGQ